MTPKKVIGRFAPSPTGPLHFGSLIAALGSYLDTRSRGGQWLVRMEDLDPPREQPGAGDDILKTLEAFGFEWDGPVIYQSQHLDLYRETITDLLKNNQAYYCTCSRKDIAKLVAGDSGTRYPGTCRGHVRPQENTSIRILTNNNEISLLDRLQGKYSWNLENEFGDFIIKRKDQLFAYHLAVVIDDAGLGVTDIIRGADLLTSTPHHLHLQQVLGLPTPHYVHLPMAVNKTGVKLSKQSHAAPINIDNAVPELRAALTFLNQSLPPEHAHCNKYELLGWAIKHWNLENIPAVKKITVN